MLLLNRIDSHVGAETVDLSDITAAVCRLQASAALDRHQEFGADITPGITVSGQADSLTMLLRNLVDNAVRYTPDGGRIDIHLARTAAGDAALIIEDSGPGIAEDQMAAVFNRFQRLSHDQPGSGLGLAIVRRIIDRHNGTITLANRGSGGFSVKVNLPAA